MADNPNSFFSGLHSALEQSAQHNYRLLARPGQIPPDTFSVFALICGRGYGKNWAAGNYTCELACSGAARRIALVGPTWDHVRQTMVEGQSGILALSPAWNRPLFEASKGQLTWASGTIATIYSADQPESLRGPEHDFAWCDEIASWRRPETWDNLMLTMRIGTPRVFVSTTPKPVRLVRELVARNGVDGVVVRHGSTYDNRVNLAPQFFAQLVRKFEGTRAARQELLGELLEDVPGALWNRANLEETRVDEAPAQLQRIVVAVDPAGSTSNENSDETGILCCALGADQHGYVLSDLSGRFAPTEWARRAVGAFHSLKADRIVVERNYGGDMAAATIASIDAGVPIKQITSSRGKILRAEPVSSLFEQKRVHLVGVHAELEDQMTSFTTDWDRGRDGSPDRVDAMVFALTELMCGESLGGYLRLPALLVNGEVAELPLRPAKVFVTMTTTDRADAAVGTIFWASSPHYGIPLTLLDYAVADVDAVLADGYIARIWQRATELAELTLASWRPLNARRSPFGIWAENDGVGANILHRGANEMVEVCKIPSKLLPPALDDRVVAVQKYVANGRLIKIAGGAHDRVVTHRGVTANHLLRQVFGYELGGHDKPAELVNAFCAGIMLALDDPANQTWPNRPTEAAALVAEVAEAVESPADIAARQAADWEARLENDRARAEHRALVRERLAAGLPAPLTPLASGLRGRPSTGLKFRF